jgi:hypothetical protein
VFDGALLLRINRFESCQQGYVIGLGNASVIDLGIASLTGLCFVFVQTPKPLENYQG